jgi:hypothetical protein
LPDGGLCIFKDLSKSEAFALEKILWVKFGWSDYYQGAEVEGNFSWKTDEGGELHEAFNFRKGPNDKYYCYVPPHGKGKSSPDSTDRDGWTVICFAKRLDRPGVHIVGWYENATLHGQEVKRREYDEPDGFRLDNKGDKFAFTIESESAFLVPPSFRVNPLVHRSIRSASFSYLSGPDEKMQKSEAKTEVRAYIERELVRLRSLSIQAPTMEKVESFAAEEAKKPKPSINNLDPNLARKRSILTMADNAAAASAASGKTSTTVIKYKNSAHHRQDLEAIIQRLIDEQNAKCALTGIALQWHGLESDKALLASLDRINSGGGYEDGNLQVVCRFVNFWKSSSPDFEFRRLLKIVQEIAIR